MKKGGKPALLTERNVHLEHFKKKRLSTEESLYMAS